MEQVFKSRSPVSRQRRLGLAIPDDFSAASKQLRSIGFTHIFHDGKRHDLAKLKKHQYSAAMHGWIVCDADMRDSVRHIARRWSAGVVKILSGSDEGRIFSSRFLPDEGCDTKIGVSLNDPHVGDCRSPNGRCMYCIGTGRLPVYPLDLIIRNKKKSVTDDGFWHPSVLTAIKGLRRTRIVPEAKFFTERLAADFLQPYDHMDKRTQFLFKNGLPWRHFLKPSAKRTDRIQDYYSWRGLFDYVYMILGKVDDKHEQRLKDGFEEQLCQACHGTGIGWEAASLKFKENSLLDLAGMKTLASVKKLSGISTPGLAAALKLNLGQLKLSSRFVDLSSDLRRRLAFSAVCTAPLENLSVIVDDTGTLPTRTVSALFAKQGMRMSRIPVA